MRSRHGRCASLWSLLIVLLLLAECIIWPTHQAEAEEPKGSEPNKYEARKQLFESMSALTGIPWPYLAAVDQYERTMHRKQKQTDKKERQLAITFSDRLWSGALNPNPSDSDPRTIAFFHGIGHDGNGDGKAEADNDEDVLYTMAQLILKHGTTKTDFRIGLWEYYQKARSVERIWQFARIYEHFDRLDLHQHAFPLPVRSEYSYRSTWGAARGWGGRRIHEGTDIFAGYGVPVRSTSYGVIEVMGWNRYGGWRIGIRDLNNHYHYYAHLSGFDKRWKEGDIVVPGDVLGWVGSSGYGKPGTQGKFPPHLHYGLYKDNGYTDWSFDPYPSLRQWEREERKRKKR
ncbi:M23 family metallopeptidase [Xylanibacillus composti]|uniref:L-Ala--D-Glu endopeptidase n=1 Tax=Xylanibacillus composti TaxID=1572762 RepID=A0A8J4H2R5_9BACL|nr:M23 family metallopeptidase [Xylanibacillus composti]GIQ68411.1 L-Ala--D-Glu endopeptidase [Xylanibacillus composti]